MRKITTSILSLAAVIVICADVHAQWQFNIYARFATPGTAQAVATYNNYALIADSDSGLAIYNLMSPSFPIYTGSYKHGDFVQEIIVDSQYAYIANWSRGIKILNITNPSAPDSIGAFNTPGMTIDLCLRGTILYAADLYNGVIIFDVSDRARPRQI